MNDQNTFENDVQDSTANDQDLTPEQAEELKEIEAILDGNAASCGAAPSEEPNDEDESDEDASGQDDSELPTDDQETSEAPVDPCDDQGGCGGGASCAG